VIDPPGRATDEFWRALEDDRFLLRRCESCDRHYFPPGPVCPHCGSDTVEWIPSDGAGLLYTFTLQRRTPPGFDGPAVVGILELDEDVRVLAAIDASYDDLAIGDRLRLVAIEYDGPFDRGGLNGKPFFEAVPVEGGTD
jgi:uncharacterized OB-fold protein